MGVKVCLRLRVLVFRLTYRGRTVVENLIGSLAERNNQTIIRESCLGGALVAGLASLVCSTEFHITRIAL